MKYDYIILGCGPAGYSAAINLKNSNNKILCIEKDKVGGECLNYGCVPSKIFIEMSKKCNFNQKKNIKIINSLSNSIRIKLQNKGIKLIENSEGIIYKKFVKVGKNKFFYKKLIISTGSLPKEINVKVDNRVVFNNKKIFTIKKIPKSVIFIGCGVISLELSFMFKNFGSKVYILEKEKNIMKYLDKDIIILLKRRMKKKGIYVYNNINNIDINKSKKKVFVKFIFKNLKKKITSDILIISIGRMPNPLKNNIGIKLNKDGFVKVDENFLTNKKNIYAIGDALGAPFLAYKAENDAVRLSETINNNIRRKNNVIPNVIFSSPEISWVGKNEQSLKKNNNTIMKFDLSNNFYAKIKGINIGFLKLIFNNKKILIGAHLFFKNSQEIIFSLYLFINYKITINDIKNLYYIHPSIHETIKYIIFKNEKIR
ncbi:Dihydrolipoamide dehydrogenase of pyruvate dehydrogenase complex [Candidatus Vidania fulgoroideae]|uniref:Dihydrolipoamide dehydrogenase of pyruvate dehydrogenase complex n=1 Tax=Candidatus Vidania fulgoroideorum TaxID=881286 RepID=A0A346E0C5_9PROT|nr:Dihydrolipoamide dehydrogenase of pyruvate dehydrogenase complex [Candidatus Vidania fulgoroideae]